MKDPLKLTVTIKVTIPGRTTLKDFLKVLGRAAEVFSSEGFPVHVSATFDALKNRRRG